MEVGSVARPVETGAVWSRGGALELIRWGDGRQRPVLAAHGYLDHGRSWDGLVPFLEGIDLVSYSARGHGYSDWADAYQWMDFVVDLAAVVHEVGSGEPIDIVAHSWGAHVAADLTRVAPSLVRRLVNLDGVVPDHPPAASPDLLERTRRSAARPAPTVRAGFATFDELVARRQALTPRVPEPVAASFARHGSVLIEGKWHWSLDPLLVSSTLPWDARDGRPLSLAAALASSVHPVLLVTGGVAEARHLTPRRTVAWEAGGRHAHVHHVHLADSGHYVHLERPDRVSELIAEFLEP